MLFNWTFARFIEETFQSVYEYGINAPPARLEQDLHAL